MKDMCNKCGRYADPNEQVIGTNEEGDFVYHKECYVHTLTPTHTL
jgi:hypothetical protein